MNNENEQEKNGHTTQRGIKLVLFLLILGIAIYLFILDSIFSNRIATFWIDTIGQG